MITEFEKGQWSVIQNVITFMEDDQTAMELCREAGFGKKKILELEKDSDTFIKEIKAFSETRRTFIGGLNHDGKYY